MDIVRKIVLRVLTIRQEAVPTAQQIAHPVRIWPTVPHVNQVFSYLSVPLSTSPLASHHVPPHTTLMFQDGASNATQTVSSASMQLPALSAKVAIP